MSELISTISVLVIVVISVAAMYFKWSNERLRKELEEWDAGQRESIDNMVRRIQESRQARVQRFDCRHQLRREEPGQRSFCSAGYLHAARGLDQHHYRQSGLIAGRPHDRHDGLAGRRLLLG
jgi:hypothetical protein